MLVHTGASQTKTPDGKKQDASNRRKQAKKADEVRASMPIGLAIFSILLILAAIAGLMVLSQLPPAIFQQINAALSGRAVPAQVAPLLTLLREQIGNVVAVTRPYFFVAIALSIGLWALHRWVYCAVLAVFGVYALYFLMLGARTSIPQSTPAIPQVASLEHYLRLIYFSLSAANFFILAFLGAYYAAYRRASQSRWNQ